MHECAINIGLWKKLEKFKKQEESKKQEISTEKKSRWISLKDMSPEDIARHIANQKAWWKKQAKQA